MAGGLFTVAILGLLSSLSIAQASRGPIRQPNADGIPYALALLDDLGDEVISFCKSHLATPQTATATAIVTITAATTPTT